MCRWPVSWCYQVCSSRVPAGEGGEGSVRGASYGDLISPELGCDVVRRRGAAAPAPPRRPHHHWSPLSQVPCLHPRAGRSGRTIASPTLAPAFQPSALLSPSLYGSNGSIPGSREPPQGAARTLSMFCSEINNVVIRWMTSIANHSNSRSDISPRRNLQALLTKKYISLHSFIIMLGHSS